MPQVSLSTGIVGIGCIGCLIILSCAGAALGEPDATPSRCGDNCIYIRELFWARGKKKKKRTCVGR